MKKTPELTMIWMKKTTRQRLRDVGRKGQTYDEIVNRLLDGKKVI